MFITIRTLLQTDIIADLTLLALSHDILRAFAAWPGHLNVEYLFREKMSCFSSSSQVCIFINVVIICIYVCPDLHLKYLSSTMCYINDLTLRPAEGY